MPAREFDTVTLFRNAGGRNVPNLGPKVDLTSADSGCDERLTAVIFMVFGGSLPTETSDDACPCHDGKANTYCCIWRVIVRQSEPLDSRLEGPQLWAQAARDLLVTHHHCIEITAVSLHLATHVPIFVWCHNTSTTVPTPAGRSRFLSRHTACRPQTIAEYTVAVRKPDLHSHHQIHSLQIAPACIHGSHQQQHASLQEHVFVEDNSKSCLSSATC